MGNIGTTIPENDIVQLVVALPVLICYNSRDLILFKGEINLSISIIGLDVLEYTYVSELRRPWKVNPGFRASLRNVKNSLRVLGRHHSL